IEAYYQEVGRAGRDGLPAEGVVILCEEDEARARLVLDDATPVAVLQSFRDGRRGVEDDITRQLYFHAGSFRGMDAELKTFQEVLEELRVTGDRGQRIVARPDDDEGKHREHALHRAVALGLVRDYVVNFSAKTMEAELAPVTRDSIIDALAKIVQRSQP